MGTRGCHGDMGLSRGHGPALPRVAQLQTQHSSMVLFLGYRIHIPFLSQQIIGISCNTY